MFRRALQGREIGIAPLSGTTEEAPQEKELIRRLRRGRRSRLLWLVIVGLAVISAGALYLDQNVLRLGQITGDFGPSPREREERQRYGAVDSQQAQALASAQSEIGALKAELGRVLNTSAEQTGAAEVKAEHYRAALVRETQRAEHLDRDLAASRHEMEALKAEQSRGTRASARGSRSAEAQVREQQETFNRERERAERLGRDLAAARQETEALKASAEQPGAAEAKVNRQQQALVRER